MTSERIFTGNYLNLDLVPHPSGKYKQEIVTPPDASAILAITPNLKIVMVKQYRPSANAKILEIPAGIIDEGETPEDTAKRELLEETGYKAKSIVELTWTYHSSGYSTGKTHLFLAYGCEKVVEQSLDVNEEIEVIELNIEEFFSMNPHDTKTLLAMLMADKYKLEILRVIMKLKELENA